MTPSGAGPDCPNIDDCGVAERMRLLTDRVRILAEANLEQSQAIGRLMAEVSGVRDEMRQALADLRDTIREMRYSARADAEQSGSFKAQELINARELAQLQEREKERRKLIATVLGGVLTAIVLVVLTALATVAIREAQGYHTDSPHAGK